MAASDWSERTRLLITIGAVAVVNLGVWGFAYKVRGDWKAEETKLNGIRAAIRSLDTEIAQKDDLEIKKKTLTDQFKAKVEKLPDKKHTDTFMQYLGDLAQQTGLETLDTVPQPDLPVTVPGIDNPQNFRRDLWKTRYKGDFKGLCTFLNKLEEHYKFFVSIEGLEINTGNAGMNVTGVMHDLKFDIETYRFLQEKP